MKNIFQRLLLKYNDFKILQIVKNKQKHILLKNRNQAIPAKENIASIIFSKDRAMQLNAFLSSYIAKVKNYGKLYIIYKCTGDRHKKSYEELKIMYAEQPFFFIEEQNFRGQLINILKEDNAKSIIFYVDDMIFIKPFDYGEIKAIDTSKYILSLTRGSDLTYSVVLDRPLKVPSFTKYSTNFNSFDWFEFNEFSDWQYPLGVSGYMFGREECLSMLENISFKAPNSLESNMQKFISLAKLKKGICPIKALTVCVHANLVQTEGTNNILGTFSIEDLLERWENSMQIDTNDFYSKDAMAAQQLSYNFIARK